MSNVAETHFGLLPEEAFRPSCGRMKLYGKSGGSAPAPDPRIGEAALMSAQQGQRFLDFMRQQYEDTKPRQERMDDLSAQMTEMQLGMGRSAEERAAFNDQRYREKFVPMEDQYLEEVGALGKAGDQARAAGAAAGDVEAQSAMQRDITNRSLMSMGVNPAAGKFMATNRANELMSMAQRAGAMTGAREGARAQGINARASAVNLGRGFNADTNAASGLALNAAGGAGNSAMLGNNYLAQRQGALGSGYDMSRQGHGQAANIYGQQYAAQTGAWAGQQQADAANRTGAVGAVATIAVAI